MLYIRMQMGIILSILFMVAAILAVIAYYFYPKTATTATISEIRENLFTDGIKPKRIQKMFSPSPTSYNFKNKVKTIDLKTNSFDINVSEDLNDFTYQVSGDIQNAKMEFYDSEKENVGSLSFIKLPGKQQILLTYEDKYGDPQKDVTIENENLLNITYRDNILIANKTSFVFAASNIKYIKIVGEELKKLMFLGIKSE